MKHKLHRFIFSGSGLATILTLLGISNLISASEIVNVSQKHNKESFDKFEIPDNMKHLDELHFMESGTCELVTFSFSLPAFPPKYTGFSGPLVDGGPCLAGNIPPEHEHMRCRPRKDYKEKDYDPFAPI